MKKIILIVLFGSMSTGCAQVMYGYGLMGAVDYAKTECKKMGLVESSPKFNQCVDTTAAQLRARNQQQTYSSSQADARSMMPRTVTCRQIGSSMQCTEF